MKKVFYVVATPHLDGHGDVVIQSVFSTEEAAVESILNWDWNPNDKDENKPYEVMQANDFPPTDNPDCTDVCLGKIEEARPDGDSYSSVYAIFSSEEAAHNSIWQKEHDTGLVKEIIDRFRSVNENDYYQHSYQIYLGKAEEGEKISYYRIYFGRQGEEAAVEWDISLPKEEAMMKYQKQMDEIARSRGEKV
ncbi:unnamed protein product [Sphagnum jensenii]